jgi:hypothetical protein
LKLCAITRSNSDLNFVSPRIDHSHFFIRVNSLAFYVESYTLNAFFQRFLTFVSATNNHTYPEMSTRHGSTLQTPNVSCFQRDNFNVGFENSYRVQVMNFLCSSTTSMLFFASAYASSNFWFNFMNSSPHLNFESSFSASA